MRIASERAQRVSHASGAGHGAPASERVGESEGRSPSGLTRREFITAAAAAPLLSPILLGMQDKAGTKAPVLGSGAFTYEAIHDWGELPSAIKWGNTHGVVEDAQRQI